MLLGFLAAAALAGVLLHAATPPADPDLPGQRPIDALDDAIARIASTRLSPDDERPLVLWFGDSTIVTIHDPSYPMIIRRETRGHIHHEIFPWVGADPFMYYALMGPTLAWHPQLVVFIAHLRVFHKEHSDPRLVLLTSLIPPALLPRTLLLPWSARNITVPRLLLERALRDPEARRAWGAWEAPRDAFQEADWWTRLGTERVQTSWDWGEERVLRMYARHVGPRNPTVEMLAADVAVAKQHGARVLVLGVPVPWQALEEIDAYHPDALASAMATLRAATEDNGGQFVDLHEALTRELFRDRTGHYTEAGSRKMAKLVEPLIRAMLAPQR